MNSGGGLMKSQSIQLVDNSYLRDVISSQKPKGLFLCCEENRWVAVDNSTNDAWTESFFDIFEAICWLLRMDELFLERTG